MASEQIAAMRAPNAVSQADALPAKQQHWQSSMQSGSLSPASNAMTRLSNAAKGSRPDNVTSAMKQGVGSYSANSAGQTRGSSSDPIPMHAKRDLETPAVPARPTSTQRHQAMHGPYAAQQVSNSPAKQDAASCSHATRAPKASRGYSHEQEAFSQIQPGHKGKQTQAGAQQQPRCSQMVDAAGSKSCKGVKASGGKVDSGNEKLQRQDTLLGNWVRWETPLNAQLVRLSCHILVALLVLFLLCRCQMLVTHIAHSIALPNIQNVKTARWLWECWLAVTVGGCPMAQRQLIPYYHIVQSQRYISRTYDRLNCFLSVRLVCMSRLKTHLHSCVCK